MMIIIVAHVYFLFISSSSPAPYPFLIFNMLGISTKMSNLAEEIGNRSQNPQQRYSRRCRKQHHWQNSRMEESNGELNWNLINYTITYQPLWNLDQIIQSTEADEPQQCKEGWCNDKHWSLHVHLCSCFKNQTRQWRQHRFYEIASFS